MSGALKRITTAEGEALPMGEISFAYQYFIKDHPGNVRAVIRDDDTGSPEVIQAKTYYPFGMVFTPEMMQGTIADKTNPYLFNGKEQQEMPGLWYDYGARMYDAQLGRFHTLDPLAENHFDFTPYNYSLNNPLLYIDPLGMDTVNVNNDTPVKKDDVVVFDDGKTIIASTDEVVVTGDEGSNTEETNDDGIEKDENNETSEINNNENKINKNNSIITAIEKRRDNDKEWGESNFKRSLEANADGGAGTKGMAIGFAIVGNKYVKRANVRGDSIKTLKHKNDSLVKVNIKLKKVNNK